MTASGSPGQAAPVGTADEQSDVAGRLVETAAHDCYPTDERYPRCVTCGREMTIREADHAWFARRRVAR